MKKVIRSNAALSLVAVFFVGTSLAQVNTAHADCNLTEARAQVTKLQNELTSLNGEYDSINARRDQLASEARKKDRDIRSAYQEQKNAYEGRPASAIPHYNELKDKYDALLKAWLGKYYAADAKGYDRQSAIMERINGNVHLGHVDNNGKPTSDPDNRITLTQMDSKPSLLQEIASAQAVAATCEIEANKHLLPEGADASAHKPAPQPNATQ